MTAPAWQDDLQNGVCAIKALMLKVKRMRMALTVIGDQLDDLTVEVYKELRRIQRSIDARREEEKEKRQK